MILLAGSNGGLPVRLLRHLGGALSRTSFTVVRNSRRVIPSMVSSPSQPFRTKHLISFRDRACLPGNMTKFGSYFADSNDYGLSKKHCLHIFSSGRRSLVQRLLNGPMNIARASEGYAQVWVICRTTAQG
jgi:hypothetical protein